MSALPQIRIVLRPRSVDEVYDLALGYLALHWRDFRSLLAVCVLVPSLVAWLTTTALEPELGSEGARAAGFIALAIFARSLEGLMTVAGGRHLFMSPTSALAGLGSALKALPGRALVTLVIWGPSVLGLTYPGEWEDFGIGWVSMVGLGYFFTSLRPLHRSEVRTLERGSWKDTSRRLKELDRGRAGRNLGFRLLAAGGRTLCIMMGMSVAATVFDLLLQLKNIDSLVLTGAALAYSAAAPLVALARLFDYIDARARTDGWDIQVRFATLVARAEAEGEMQ